MSSPVARGILANSTGITGKTQKWQDSIICAYSPVHCRNSRTSCKPIRSSSTCRSASRRWSAARRAQRAAVLAWLSATPRLRPAPGRSPRRRAIALEERVPYFSKRMDACLFGYTKDGTPHTTIVELKAWGDAEATADGNVRTVIGGAPQDEPHPSAQVHGYHEHLEDFCRAFQGPERRRPGLLRLRAQLPGHHPRRGALPSAVRRAAHAEPNLRRARRGAAGRATSGRACRRPRAGGRWRLRRAGLGPSKQLIEHAGRMIHQQSVFRLLDEQIAANNAILRAMTSRAGPNDKHVILVRGGPGTGKSVIALNVLGEILRRQLKVYLVTGSSAFTHGMRRILGERLDGLVRFTDFFWNFDPDSVDVLIVDEAHRVRAKSEPKVLRDLRPTIIARSRN